jgi:hypothetical protein
MQKNAVEESTEGKPQAGTCNKNTSADHSTTLLP